MKDRTKTLTTVCMRCLLLKHQVGRIQADTQAGELSHGICREHELEMLLAEGTATVAEQAELAEIRAGYLDLTVRVPGYVADRLKALCAELERHAGRAPDARLVAGLALARDLNRGEYDETPLNVYAAPQSADPAASVPREEP